MTEKRFIPPVLQPPEPTSAKAPPPELPPVLQPPEPPLRSDGLLSPEALQEAEEAGVERARLGFVRLFSLAVLGGAFVGLGVVLATTIGSGTVALPEGLGRLLGGLALSLGFVAAVLTGSELFAGNNRVMMALVSRRISFWRLLGHWIIVFWGNLAGAGALAVLVFASEHYILDSGGVGQRGLQLALDTVNAGFLQLTALGILGNVLLCLALWLAMAARSMPGVIAALLLPLAALTTMGFQHVTANMYAVLAGLLMKGDLSLLQRIGTAATDYAQLSWSGFLWHSLLPVAIGNLIGGPVLVGLAYGFIRLREQEPVDPYDDPYR